MTTDAFPYDLVMIRWDDAETSHGWENESEIKTSVDLVRTVGYLVKRDRRYVVVVAASVYFNETDKEHAFNARVTIPRGMVKSMSVLVPKNTNPVVEVKA